MNTINNFESVCVTYATGYNMRKNAENILNILEKNGTSRVKPIADELHISVQRCTAMLNKLRALGLVKREEESTTRETINKFCYGRFTKARFADRGVIINETKTNLKDLKTGEPIYSIYYEKKIEIKDVFYSLA